ncbi:MAG: type IV toxin-antitoxin system AbiEi family antitoxin domain-containing protein [Bacteroidales bacterium]
MHIAAHSALELAGFSHYVPMGKPSLIIFHSKEEGIPKWMNTNELDYSLKFFSTEIFSDKALVSFNAKYPCLSASPPELAYLECLHLAPRHYGYMDLYYIMEQMTTLRPNVLQNLLENTGSNKVKRMFLYMAEKSGHYWYNSLNIGRLALGTAKYKLVDNGTYVSKYKITIPKELQEYE